MMAITTIVPLATYLFYNISKYVFYNTIYDYIPANNEKQNISNDISENNNINYLLLFILLTIIILDIYYINKFKNNIICNFITNFNNSNCDKAIEYIVNLLNKKKHPEILYSKRFIVLVLIYTVLNIYFHTYIYLTGLNCWFIYKNDKQHLEFIKTLELYILDIILNINSDHTVNCYSKDNKKYHYAVTQLLFLIMFKKYKKTNATNQKLKHLENDFTYQNVINKLQLKEIINKIKLQNVGRRFFVEQDIQINNNTYLLTQLFIQSKNKPNSPNINQHTLEITNQTIIIFNLYNYQDDFILLKDIAEKISNDLYEIEQSSIKQEQVLNSITKDKTNNITITDKSILNQIQNIILEYDNNLTTPVEYYKEFDYLPPNKHINSTIDNYVNIFKKALSLYFKNNSNRIKYN